MYLSDYVDFFFLQIIFMFGEYMKSKYPGQYLSKGQNMRRLLIDAYEEAFEKYDVVAMPTIPFTAPKLPPSDINASG